MKQYLDGFVLCVPEKNLEAYQKMAEKAGEIWKEHGALQYIESVIEDDTAYPHCMSFKELAQPKEGEKVVFSLIVFKSREHRDEVNAKVMEDSRMECDMDVFDGKRMAYNGFETIVNL